MNQQQQPTAQTDEVDLPRSASPDFVDPQALLQERAPPSVSSGLFHSSSSSPVRADMFDESVRVASVQPQDSTSFLLQRQLYKQGPDTVPDVAEEETSPATATL